MSQDSGFVCDWKGHEHIKIPQSPGNKAKGSEDARLSASDRLKRIVKRADSKEKEDSKVLEGGSDKVLHEFERVIVENGIKF